MADTTEGSIEIDAAPKEIMAAITDFESYPEWVDGIRTAEVRTMDGEGRATEVAFEFSTMGFSATYTLAYRYTEGDAGLSWRTVEAAGAVRDIEGEYALQPLDGDTEVTYRLAVDVAVPVPGFLKRRADRLAITTALEGLKRRVEGG